jgi:hypothetical protein
VKESETFGNLETPKEDGSMSGDFSIYMRIYSQFFSSVKAFDGGFFCINFLGNVGIK